MCQCYPMIRIRVDLYQYELEIELHAHEIKNKLNNFFFNFNYKILWVLKPNNYIINPLLQEIKKVDPNHPTDLLNNLIKEPKKSNNFSEEHMSSEDKTFRNSMGQVKIISNSIRLTKDDFNPLVSNNSLDSPIHSNH